MRGKKWLTKAATGLTVCLAAMLPILAAPLSASADKVAGATYVPGMDYSVLQNNPYVEWKIFDDGSGKPDFMWTLTPNRDVPGMEPTPGGLIFQWDVNAVQDGTNPDGSQRTSYYRKSDNSSIAYEYTLGETVYLNELTGKSAIGEGEHYYRKVKEDNVKVWKWTVIWPGRCIHGIEDVEGVEPIPGTDLVRWKGDEYPKPGKFCYRGYYSGWMGYCSDCGEKLEGSMLYTSKEAVSTLSELPAVSLYYPQRHSLYLD